MNNTKDAKLEWKRIRDENRNCRHCGGNGMPVVFHPRWAGGRVLQTSQGAYPVEVAAHCSCPAGQWIRDRTSPDLQRRIPWVADILAGRSRWSLNPPGRDDAGDAIPDAPTRAQIARLFKPAGGAA